MALEKKKKNDLKEIKPGTSPNCIIWEQSGADTRTNFHWIVTNFYGCGSKNKERWVLQSSNKLDASYTKATAGWVTIKANYDERKSKCWYTGLWKPHLAGFLHNFLSHVKNSLQSWTQSLGCLGQALHPLRRRASGLFFSLSSFIVNYFNHARVLPLFLKNKCKAEVKVCKRKTEFSKKYF